MINHEKSEQLMDAINDMGNALTSAKWPDAVETAHGTTIPATKEIFPKLVAGQKEFYSLETDFHDAVNELCYKCGSYKKEHEGACDGCRWQKPRRGW